jgi:transcription-repair coupling factor (superfamily II helicase)
VPPIHRSFTQSLSQLQTYPCLYLSELAESNTSGALNLSSRPVPVLPHQFAKLAETLREESKNRTLIFIISA